MDVSGCDQDHIMIGKDGHIICYEDHLPEVELTISDLTGEEVECFNLNEILISAIHGYDGYNIKTIDIDALLRAGAKVNYVNYFGVTPLMAAAQYGKTAVVPILLHHGADIHVDVDYPIRWAASLGHTRMVITLLEHGADVHALQDSALVQAKKNKRWDVVNVIENFITEEKFRKRFQVSP
jgi:ankyrin repeat protein